MTQPEKKELIISVGIVAFNEENCLPTLFSQILAQDYKKENTELLFINSMSTDKTVALFEEFKEIHKDEYFGIKLLDNEKKIQASGWNAAIANFSGDALIRVDAHARLNPDFISRNVDCLNSGEMVCGGMRPNLPQNNTWKERLILLCDNSLFGGSVAKYHSSEEKSYTKSVFHGCYRREVLEKVGGFNEELGRTEDNDFHSRIIDSGFRICYDPSIKSFQYSRDTVGGFLKQKRGNGYWIGKTLFISPRCLSLFHFVPFGFFSALILCLLLSVWSPLPLAALLLLYFALAIAVSVKAAKASNEGISLALMLPIMFFLMHLVYGAGTLGGLFAGLFRRKR